MVWASDATQTKVEHERFWVYTNGDRIGLYEVYGNDVALWSIERRLMQQGFVPASIKLTGNRIEILSDDDNTTVARFLRKILIDG